MISNVVLSGAENAASCLVLQGPLSWATNVAQRFTYSYHVELPASGGIRIHLKGQNLGQPSPFPCCVPDTRNLTIDVAGS
jgi:hypothetical protein